jgi:hypothetical protein
VPLAMSVSVSPLMRDEGVDVLLLPPRDNRTGRVTYRQRPASRFPGVPVFSARALCATARHSTTALRQTVVYRQACVTVTSRSSVCLRDYGPI